MTQPTQYNTTTNFAEYQTAHSDAPFNGALIDAEYENIETTLDAVTTNLAVIQRDDTALKNLSVHPDALSVAVRALISSAAFTIDDTDAAWVTATLYPTGRIVENSGTVYVCVEAHTSGTFATDLAAVKWCSLGAVVLSVIAENVTFSPTSTLAANNVQEAIEELDTETRNFIQSGSGAVTRTAQNKMRDLPSPEDFGAVGDGVTDDITAINAALQAHTYVKFSPNKTYLISSYIIPKDESWLDCRDSKIKLKNSSNTHMFRAPTGVDDFTVEGGDWDGNKANQTGGNGFTNETAGANLRARLINLTVHDCFSHGIGWNATTTKYVIESGIIAYNNGASGVGSVAGIEYAAIVGNIAYSNITSNFGGSGITKHTTYVGNVGFDAGTADNFTGYGAGTDHVAVVGNISSGGDNHGIHIGGTFITITGNAIDAPIEAGVHLLLSAGAASGTVVVGNAIDAPGGSGVNADEATQFAIGLNVVIGATDHGYILATNNKDGTVVGNLSKSAGVDGFRTEASANSQVAIVGNASISSVSDGFQIANTTEALIAANTAKDNAAAFNESGTSNTNIVSGNDFIGNTSNTPVLIGAATQWRENAAGGTNSLASATTITLPMYTDYIYITGTTAITSVTASWARRIVTLRFDGILTFTDGSNLKLATDFVTSTNYTITLICDGTDWYEQSRSTN